MPRAIWRRILDASKAEALLAVDLYNRPRHYRRVEGFFVHMHLAWQLLFHAKFRRDGVDYRYRQPGSIRFVKVDGEPKTWTLIDCVKHEWPDSNDPVRRNLELTISLRNKIEHRYTDEAIDVATAGYAQASLLNYENELVATFGQEHSLSNSLRFPVFIGTFTHASAEQMKQAKESMPAEVRSLIEDFQSELESDVLYDTRYEFRVHLVQQTGPKTEADLALHFVREDDLTEKQREVLAGLGREGTLIVRERERPVRGLNMLKPGQVVDRVAPEVPFVFNMYHLTQSYKRLGVRPPRGDETPERTDERYAIYDKPHRDYVYTEAFVDKLIRKAQTEEGFRELTGTEPRQKPA